MNNIEEKVKKILHDWQWTEKYSEESVKQICSLLQPPQPSEEEIERMALIAYKPHFVSDSYGGPDYDLFEDKREVWIDGFKSGLSYRSKEEWVSVAERKEIKGGWYLVIDPNSQSGKYALAFYRVEIGIWHKDNDAIIHPSHYRSIQPPIY